MDRIDRCRARLDRSIVVVARDADTDEILEVRQ
jgi:hypothetical protein